MAVMAYGVANLDKQLSRDGVFLRDGIYADINTSKGRVMVSLDYKNAPETVSSFVKLCEDPNAQRGRRRRGGGQQTATAIGTINKIDSKKAAMMSLTAEANVSRAVSSLSGEKNPVLKHDKAGVLGMINPTNFYITSDKKKNYDKKYTAIGTVIAGLDIVKLLKKDDSIRGVRITRVGKKALDFK